MDTVRRTHPCECNECVSARNSGQPDPDQFILELENSWFDQEALTVFNHPYFRKNRCEFSGAAASMTAEATGQAAQAGVSSAGAGAGCSRRHERLRGGGMSRSRGLCRRRKMLNGEEAGKMLQIPMCRNHVSHMRALLEPSQHERRRSLSTTSVQKTSALSISSNATNRTLEPIQALGILRGSITTLSTRHHSSRNQSLRKTRMHIPVNRSRSASAPSATQISPQNREDGEPKLLLQRLPLCPCQRQPHPSE